MVAHLSRYFYPFDMKSSLIIFTHSDMNPDINISSQEYSGLLALLFQNAFPDKPLLMILAWHLQVHILLNGLIEDLITTLACFLFIKEYMKSMSFFGNHFLIVYVLVCLGVINRHN